MNERIKELAEQCHHRYSEHQIDLEKFAELIVRECIELCDGNHEHKNQTDTLFSKGVTTGIQLSQQAIKTHFGVEE